MTDVKVELEQPEESYKWYNMCVSEGKADTISFNSKRVTFNIGAYLVPKYEPVQLMRYVSPIVILNGYRYYFKVKITLVYDGDTSDSGGSTSFSDLYLANADLFAPDTVYQGHKVLLQDVSEFSLGNRFYTAYAFYKNGYGSNVFTRLSGPGDIDFSRCDENSAGYYSDRIAHFSTSGDYKIKLTAFVYGGMISTDTERIKVLPVPEVKATISGAKTSMLKQELNITEALNPEARMINTEVLLETTDGKESVKITATPDGKSVSTGNTATINAGDLQLVSSNEEFAVYKLYFITKNKEDKSYKATVVVKDSSGKSNTFTSVFTVKADHNYKPKISGDKTSVRQANSNIANINLRDSSDYGGVKVERKWEYFDGKAWTDEFEYTDLSLGMGENIVVHKSGVGKAKYRLTVRPVYDEDNSLPEFIKDEDRGGGTTVFETEVINMQPFVSFKTLPSYEVNLTLLYEEGKEDEALIQKEYLSSALAENGLKGNVNIRKIIGNISSSDHYGDFKVISSPFSYKAQLYSYDGGNYISDSKMYYQVEATYGSYGGGSVSREPEPKPPYYVKAYNLETGKLIWTTKFESSVFNMGNTFTINQDDREEYLFISNSSKTLVLNKKDGTIIKILNFPVEKVYRTDNYLISVETDIIRKINLSTGEGETVASGNYSGSSEMINGLINFAEIENGKLARKTLDPATMTITSIDHELGTGDNVNLGFDLRGYIVVGSPVQGKIITMDRTSAYNVGKVTLYDEDGEIVKQIGTSIYNSTCHVIKDADGSFLCALCGGDSIEKVVENRITVSYYKNGFAAITLNGSAFSPIVSNKKKNAYISTSKALLGYNKGDGLIFYTASNHGYSWTSGISYDNNRKTCLFDYTRSTGRYDYYNESKIESSYSTDYDSGYDGENSGCLQWTYGLPAKDGISGSATAFAPYYKTIQTLVKSDLNRYLRNEKNTYNGVFILSGSDIRLSDTEKNNYYNVDNSSELRASVNEYLTNLSSKLNGSNDEKRLIYDKGETVNIIGEYFDYEGDPSKESCYVYYHYPYNDGVNPQANHIVDEDFNIVSTSNNTPYKEPLTSFKYDGMYKVEHWQYDSSGDPSYDKKSNVASIVFFVRSNKNDSLPSIDKISVSPAAPREGQEITASIKVSDSMSADLSGKAEVFKDGYKIGEYSFSNLKPDYPEISFTAVKDAKTGSYSILCRVYDGQRQNIKSLDFSVLPGYTLTSGVNHTLQWENNRKNYNLTLFGSEGSFTSDYRLYKEQTAPRLRTTNVFWSEEKLNISAYVEGNPTVVNAQIKGTVYCSVLTKTNEADVNGNFKYEGYLWSSDFKRSFGKSYPVEAVVCVIAYYDDGTSTSHEENIIFDDSDDYWRVHKLY